MQNRQNLNIEQFSLFSSHVQSLLNNCISNLPNELNQTNTNQLGFVDCDRKFICALKATTKAGEKEGEEVHGIQVQIFQSIEFRNLLHLDLFFRKASDEEARVWLARKQVIAWGIINEITIEIEKHQDINAKDSQ